MVEHTPISSYDIFPTVLSYAGIDIQKGNKIDGVNILPYIGKEDPPERPMFWHYPHYSNQGGNPGSAVRLGEYKLIHDIETGKLELYNLRNDIGEKKDLSAEKPAIRDKLFTLLDNWRKSAGAKMMIPNPEWDRKESIIN